MPEIGRFLSQDPLGIGHPYAYCDSNPVGWVDPEGLGARDWLIYHFSGAGEKIDKYLLLGRTANYGRVTGLHDIGCASGLEVAWAGAQWGTMMSVVALAATEAPGARLALRPRVLGAQLGVYGRFWGFADLRHAAHHTFLKSARSGFLRHFGVRPFKAPHVQIALNTFGKVRMLRIPYWW